LPNSRFKSNNVNELANETDGDEDEELEFAEEEAVFVGIDVPLPFRLAPNIMPPFAAMITPSPINALLRSMTCPVDKPHESSWDTALSDTTRKFVPSSATPLDDMIVIPVVADIEPVSLRAVLAPSMLMSWLETPLYAANSEVLSSHASEAAAVLP
jgi:hypothetical protein